MATDQERPGLPALDVSQDFAPATSYEVRDEFEKLVRLDLLGPWEGELEQFAPRAQGPRERYLVGMLGPKPAPRGTGAVEEAADEAPETEIGVEGDAGEGDLPDVVTPQNLGKLWASSMGLSFAVADDVGALAVTASWGHYSKAEVEVEDAKGHVRPMPVWGREPIRFDREIRPADQEPYYPLTMDGPDEPGVLLALTVRPQRDGRRVVELTLINKQEEPERNADTAWLFQAELRVTAADGEACVFLPLDDPLDTLNGGDHEDRHLKLLYRRERRYASGRNVAVHANVPEGMDCARELRTTWLPAYDVPATVAPVGAGTPLADVELSMDVLAVAEPEELTRGLMPLVDGYTSWLDDQEGRIPGLPAPLRETAETAVRDARSAAERIRAGIALLVENEQARAAFRFANEAMALQRRRTEVGRLRERDGLSFQDAKAKVDAEGAKAASWRPFQLAFVLLNLPALTDPDHPERAADPAALVDLLFFPTGGGKTEAYLGLTAYTFAIRRLRGLVGSGADARDGRAGVAVLMRYTLRLLTAQQFQRAAALVCAAEVLRRRDPATWGREPFRIGLWVGGAVSPNWFTDAARQIDEAKEAPESRRTNVLQTLTCPWCGEKLTADTSLDTDEIRRRVLLYCGRGRENDPDPCPFSRIWSTGEGLPILTVDEEIYRLVPSLVIATVDKLAQLPWRGYAGHLFGRVSRRCPRHGYRHEDLDERTGCADRHNARGDLPKAESEPVARLRPPDLIIQDELHLISGALGTTVGLFESAVDELCTWRSGDEPAIGPKIVASTATTRRADRQVRGIFARDLAVFPPQVLDVTDTFFSTQVPVTPETPGRRYMGVCAHGTRLKSAEIRMAEILLLAGQTMLDRYGAPADPYLTVVGYFNATRELAGMRRYLDDDVATRVRRLGPVKGLSNRLPSRRDLLNIVELTSRISSGDISDVLRRLENTFDPELDTSDRRRDIRAEIADVMRERDTRRRRAYHPLADRYHLRQRDAGRQPVDVVLATSMLQVGVDVSRFGLMVVTGQPKNTAEYIQASSRVGRDPRRPGLVITLYNWSRPRDLAHYEDFEPYHATFYRQVEALSVTPYTRRALDRGTTAMFVGAVRNAEEPFSANRQAEDVPLTGPAVTSITDRLLARAEAAGGPRGRGYLRERINVILDRWEREKSGPARLGYEKRKSTRQEIVVGLLDHAGNGRWGDLTAGNSMRETENEINLLLPPAGDIFTPLYNAPAWEFTASDDLGPEEEEET